MGFFSNILGAAVKTVLTPVAVVKDVVNVTIGEEPNATKKLVNGIVDDIGKALDNLTGDDL